MLIELLFLCFLEYNWGEIGVNLLGIVISIVLVQLLIVFCRKYD